MVGLGHEVSFGGMFTSDLETGYLLIYLFDYDRLFVICLKYQLDDDHNRLRNIGAKLYRYISLLLSIFRYRYIIQITLRY